MKVHVVVIGTSGNQRYIFSSTKRRENVGGSHLITRVEGAWLDAALRQVGGSRTGRIEGGPVEVVTANAGGVTALTRDRETGRALVREVTRLALREAPGLDVCGVVGEPVEWGAASVIAEAFRRTRERLPVARMARPGPQMRFPGVPIVARCGSSGSPAQRMWPAVRRPERSPAGEGAVAAPGEQDAVAPERDGPEPRSASSIAKLDAFPDALTRLVAELDIAADTERRRGRARAGLGEVVDHLGYRSEWVAVVHADGNGMGEVFQSFDSIMTRLGLTTARDYVDGLRGLSEGVDACARTAVRTVLRELRTPCGACQAAGAGRDEAVGSGRSARCRLTVGGQPPVLPLVLGGDDLTVVCDGTVALPFAERYLTEFAREAAAHRDVGGLLGAAGLPGLGACAGVAIVKRNYPFHSAARLAEELTKEAKRVKRLGRERCALSFHVLYESAAADLDRLRAGMRLPDGTRLTAQPYLLDATGGTTGVAAGGAADGTTGVVAGGAVPAADPDGAPAADWASGRRWSDLRRRATALARIGARGERAVPGGAAHDLRSGLFIGRDLADARFTELAERLGDPAVAGGLAGDEGSLFFHDGEGAVTGLLDAMEAARFLTGHDPRVPPSDGGPPGDGGGHEGGPGHGGPGHGVARDGAPVAAGGDAAEVRA